MAKKDQFHACNACVHGRINGFGCVLIAGKRSERTGDIEYGAGYGRKNRDGKCDDYKPTLWKRIFG